MEDTAVEGEAPEELQGLELGYIPELHSRVKVIGYPTGGDNVSVTRGVVSRIEPQQYAYSIVHNLLAIQIDAAINPGNSGGPALDENNKIVGVAFQSLMGADNIGYIIPTPIIEHFIEDVQRNGQYLGFSRLGVYTQILDQAYAAREYLKLKKDMVCIYFSVPKRDICRKHTTNKMRISFDRYIVSPLLERILFGIGSSPYSVSFQVVFLLTSPYFPHTLSYLHLDWYFSLIR